MDFQISGFSEFGRLLLPGEPRRSQRITKPLTNESRAGKIFTARIVSAAALVTASLRNRKREASDTPGSFPPPSFGPQLDSSTSHNYVPDHPCDFHRPAPAIAGVLFTRLQKKGAAAVSIIGGVCPWLLIAVARDLLPDVAAFNRFSILGSPLLFLVAFFLYGGSPPVPGHGRAAGACIIGGLAAVSFLILSWCSSPRWNEVGPTPRSIADLWRYDVLCSALVARNVNFSSRNSIHFKIPRSHSVTRRSLQGVNIGPRCPR